MSLLVPAWLSALEIIGWSLLHFLWQGCVIGALYALVRSQLPTERADLRYAAGLAAMALLALCIPLTASLLAQAEPSVVAAAANASMQLDAIDATTTSRFDLDALMPWLVSLWSIGVLVFALRAIREIRGYARIVANASSNAQIDRLLQAVAIRVGYLRDVRVLVSDLIDTPTLFGWLRPVILLPTAVALNFPRQQLELILAHELSHLRRYDHYINLAQTVVETLLFYHPVVHWIGRDVRHEREVCCDRLVLGADRQASTDYVRTLAALQELRLQSSQLVLAASGGFLLDRVQRILLVPAERPQQTRSNASYWILLTMLLGGALLVATQLREQRESLERLGQSLLEKLPRPPVALMFDLALDVSRDLAIAIPSQQRLVLPAVARVVEPLTIESRTVDRVAVENVRRESATLSLTAETAGASNVLATSEATSTAPIATISAIAERFVAPLSNAASIELDAASQSRLPAASLPRPRLLRRVMPSYPDAVPGRSQGHVEFEFALASDGTVKDVVVISGDANGRFAAAARDALRQWQFAPAGVSAGLRLRQDFLFRESTTAADTNSIACRRSTGSHICPSARNR
ncbi:MAG: M56 family metallopeptidase [Dokdonella sp.]